MPFDSYQVPASSVSDFIDRYYKPSRIYTDVPDYEKTLKDSHSRDFERDGFDIISKHDSKTGEVVCYKGTDKWPDRKVITQAQWIQKRNHEYTSVIDGDCFILDMNERGATILNPVYIMGEFAQSLPSDK